jgi:hypothetical protein
MSLPRIHSQVAQHTCFFKIFGGYSPGLRGCLTIDIIPEIAPISSFFSTWEFAKNQPLDSL